MSRTDSRPIDPATGTTPPPTGGDSATPPTPPGKTRPYLPDHATLGVCECYGANYATDPLGREPLWVNTPAEYVNSHLARGYSRYILRLPTGQSFTGPQGNLVPPAHWRCLTPQQQKAAESIPDFVVYGQCQETDNLDTIIMDTAAMPDLNDPVKSTHHSNLMRDWRTNCPGFRGQIYDMGAYNPFRAAMTKMIDFDRRAGFPPAVEAIPCVQTQAGGFALDPVFIRYVPSYAMLAYLDARDPARTWRIPRTVEVRICLSIWNFGGYAVWQLPESHPQRRFVAEAARQRVTELWGRGFCLAVMESPLDPIVRGVTGE